MLKKLLSAITGAVLVVSIPIAGLAVERYEILQVGDEDAWVMELQVKLNEEGYLSVPATGYYGTNTQNAVIQYQKDHGLSVDGKAGPATRKAILGDAYTEITGPRTPGADSALTAPEDEPAAVSGSVTETEPEQTAAPSEKPEAEPSSESKPEAEPSEAPAESPEASGDDTEIDQDGEETGDGTTLQLGDKGEAISKLQQTLRDYDYYDYGSITGYFGPVTKDAVVRFQRMYGLAEDGVVGPEAQAILASGELKYYTMQEGDQGADVEELQTQLKKLGYLTGTATGYYGDVTRRAVQDFQRINGLDTDGTAGKETRQVLFSDEAASASEESAEAAPQNLAEAENPAEEPESAAGIPSAAPEDPAASQEPSENPAGEDPEASKDPADEKDDSKPNASSASGSIEKFLDVAESRVGKSYVYGAVGPNSFDCSGFVYYALKGAGVGVSRLSSAGYASCSSWESVTSKSDLKIGDLVFFRSDSSSAISHVGIYLGGGNIIHAAPSLEGVGYSTMSSGYYSRNFVSAKRVF